MRIWRGLEQVTDDGGAGSVVTIGNFDGVHRGHAEVLRRVVTLARLDGLTSVAVTFDPHPAMVHRPQSAPPRLMRLDTRLARMADLGLDATLVVPYTAAFAALTADEFIELYLVAGLRARTVVVGHDFRFGAGNSGGLSTLVAAGKRHGFEVVAVSDLGNVPDLGGIEVLDGTSPRWSSSAVRSLVTTGNVAEAAEVLGRPHRVTGTVIHGDARGRELGFPTANLGGVAELVPADGVYAGWLVLERDGVRHPAAISIGTNPTFEGKTYDGDARRVEAFVIDREDADWTGFDIYGEQVALDFAERLRPTIRFDSSEALITQMHDDVANVRSVLAD